jgi:hypothetical protein
MKVFIGYDSREDVAYRVAARSMQDRASIELDIEPLVLSDLRRRGIYTREADPLSSTEFSFTRFLVP